MINLPNDLSKFCFGCEPLGGVDWGEVNIKEISTAIELAVDYGVNFFDTAAVYGLGLSETRLSKILGNKRHDIYIATKGGLVWENKKNSNNRTIISKNSAPKIIRKSVEESLARLRIDKIPIYYIHWPDLNVDIRYTFDELSKLQHEQKIIRIGCSNFNINQLKKACSVACVSLLQIPINLLNLEKDQDLITFSKNHNVGITAYNVLASGLLTGKFNSKSKFHDNDRRKRSFLFQESELVKLKNKIDLIKNKANQKNITCAQYSISKVLELDGVVATIIGIKTVNQFLENINAFHQ
jgi:myo-inositol catabolism protein IolS